MKKLLLFAFISFGAIIANAQISSDTVTYKRGSLGVQSIFPVNTNSGSSCTDTIGISIPSGHWIASLEISYELQTQGGAFGGVSPSDVGTYLELVSESSKEFSVTYGNSNIDGDTESLTRMVNDFNGAVTDTFLIFKLHPLRQGFNANCDTNQAKLIDSTFRIVVNHYPAPTCFQPTNLTVDWKVSNQVQLSWLSGGSNSWEVEYGTPGFAPGSGTRVSALSNPFILNGLSASTAYEFIVRDSCGINNVSLWSIGTIDSTRCTPISFTSNYLEDFNDARTWISGSGFNNDSSIIPNCWLRNPTSPNGGQGYAWGVADDSTATPGTGPISGRGGSGQYLYAEASGAQNQSVAQITSPLIDLSSLNTPELNFYYHMRGAQVNELKTEVWSKSTGWINVGTINGPQQMVLTDSFLLQSYTLSQFANDTVLIRFSASRGFGQSNQSDIAIDDVSFEEAPTCPNALNLSVLSRSLTSITLGWSAVNATSWDIQYGVPGSFLGAPANSTISSTTNPKKVTGLMSGTTYQFWVREVCGLTDKSGWIGPVIGTTHCAPLSAPWSENFDSTNWVSGSGVYNTFDTIAPCWARTPEKDTLPSSPFSWGVRNGTTTTGQTGPTADVSGLGNYIYAEASSGAPDQEAFIESPLIDLTSLAKPRISFYYHMRGLSVNTLKLQIWVDSTKTWNTYFTKTGNQGNQWLFEEIDLSGFTGDTIALRWSAIKGGGSQGDIAIDEVVVDDQPLCPEPSNFVLTDVTSSTATFSWTTGGSANWNLIVGPSGFTPFTTGLTNLTTTTGVVTGLIAGTKYDGYVRDTCGVFGASIWIGPITFNTLCNPYTAPYIENFDSTSWVTGANQTLGQIDECWQRKDTLEYFWKAGPPVVHTNNSGPSGDNTSGSGGYIFTEANTGVGNNVFTSEIISPFVDVSSLTVPELSFYYHMYGSLINKLDVQVRSFAGNWNTLETISGAQQSNSSDSWKERIIDISFYAGDTIQIKFIAHRYQGSNNQVDISIDDVDIHEQPTCPKPSLFIASNISSTSVDLSWISGGASNWLIKYTSGSIIPVGSNPYTLSGLTPNTSYNIWVRDSCGPGDVSPWLGPITISTLCGMETAPWTEDFEGLGFDVISGDFDPCYTIGNSATYFWQTGQGTTPTGNSGPTRDHTTGSGKYGYTEVDFNFNGDLEAEMVTMEIDLDTLSTPELSFWWHAAGSNIDELTVDIFDGRSWNQELTINNTNNTLQSVPGDPWKEAVVDLINYVGDTIKLRFTASRVTASGFNSTQSDWAIDDIAIDNAPTCFKPTAIASTASTTTSVTLNWITGGASNWQIEYGVPGFTLGTGTIINALSNPFTVTGLSPSSSYEFWLRDSCSATDLSDWAGPFTFSTSCGNAVAPYVEDFENGFVGGIDNGQGHNIGATISPCWTRSDTDTNYRWGGRNGGTATGPTGPSGDHTTGFGSYVYTEASFSSGTPSATLTSPSIVLNALNTPELRFWYHMWAQGGGTQGTLVWAVKDVAVGTWINLDSISGNQGNNWIEVVEDLSAFANKTIQIRFTSKKSSGNNPQYGDIAIDDMSIDEAPTCPDPYLLTATAVSTTDMSLAWTTGGATSWQVEYGTTGFTPTTGTIVNVATNPYIISGLAPGTSYDFYVRDSCGPSDVSEWVGPASAATLNCVGGCSYTLELTDTYGDGWAANGQNTQFHQIAVTTGGITTNYTMSNSSGALGNSETFTLNICDGDTLYLVFVDNGQWNNECGYTLRDFTGTIVSSVSAGNLNSGVQFQGLGNCTTPCPAPTSVFNFTNNFLSVNFDGSLSTGTLLTYSWDFGDGNNGIGATPTHVYAAAGTYFVTLTATDSCNQSIDFKDTLSVCMQPTATFSAQILSASASGMQVQFDGTNSIGGSSYLWNFGDGNTNSTTNYPLHTYAVNSTSYLVSLTVYNSCGDSNTYTSSLKAAIDLEELIHSNVKIFPNPTQGFITLESEAGLQGIISLIDALGRTAVEFNANGLNNQTINVSHLSAGTYVLTVLNNGDLFQQRIQIIK